MDSTIVIKVKYTETVRRFYARVVDGEFDFNTDKLRDKIVRFFKFSRDTEFTMTYIDEDNDVVTMVDDDDLRDVVRQGLDPLRITVTLSTERSGESSFSFRTSATSKLLGSPWFQLVQNWNSQDPVCRFFTEYITRMNQFSGLQSDPDASAHGSSTNERVTGDVGDLKINEAGNSAPMPAATANLLWGNQSEMVFLKTDEVKSQSSAEGTKTSARKNSGFASQMRAALASRTHNQSEKVFLKTNEVKSQSGAEGSKLSATTDPVLDFQIRAAPAFMTDNQSEKVFLKTDEDKSQSGAEGSMMSARKNPGLALQRMAALASIIHNLSEKVLLETDEVKSQSGAEDSKLSARENPGLDFQIRSAPACMTHNQSEKVPLKTDVVTSQASKLDAKLECLKAFEIYIQDEIY